MDSQTGLQFSRARWYDAAIGRFISEDPMGLRGGGNLFGYVNNKPERYFDPFGLEGEDANEPALWSKPNVEQDSWQFQNPQNLNPFTSNSNSDFATAFFWDRLKMAWGDIPLGRTLESFAGARVPGQVWGTGTPFKPMYSCESKAGVPGLGEAVTTLEMGPDVYNTVDTLQRRNHDINDAITCAQGGPCRFSPYDSQLGSRVPDRKYDDLSRWEKFKCYFWGNCPAN